MDPDLLLADLTAGKTAALARAISAVENGRPGFERLLAGVHRSLGRARLTVVSGGLPGSETQTDWLARLRSARPRRHSAEGAVGEFESGASRFSHITARARPVARTDPGPRPRPPTPSPAGCPSPPSRPCCCGSCR